MESALKQKNPEDKAFKNHWQNINDHIVLNTLLFMSLVNLLVFWKYKHCKFDRPYVFVVLAYNLGYLVDAVLATLSLMDY